MADSQFPAKSGVEIAYRCPQKHAKKGGEITAICENGQITFPDGSPHCSKIGTELNSLV